MNGVWCFENKMILNIKHIIFTCVHEKKKLFLRKTETLVKLKSNIIFNKIGNDIKFI